MSVSTVEYKIQTFVPRGVTSTYLFTRFCCDVQT